MNVVKELVAAASELVAADKIRSSEWLTVDQVRGMCAACADSMQSKGISRVKASVFLAKMTWEQCISKAKKNPKVDDPEKLCGWLKSHGPNASTASLKTESQSDKFEVWAKQRPNYMAQVHPNWLADNYPDIMANIRPGWMASYRSEWMFKHYPKWFKDHKASEGNSKTSADVLLQAVAKAIQGKSFMTLRATLTGLGIGRVDMYDSGDVMHWRINTKSGKKIVVVSSRGAEADQDDIVVGDLLVGYAPEGRRF